MSFKVNVFKGHFFAGGGGGPSGGFRGTLHTTRSLWVDRFRLEGIGAWG